jgi:hypothetical protein
MFCDLLVDQAAIPEVPKLKESAGTTALLETFNVIVVAVKQPGLDYSISEKLQGVKVYTWQR